MSKNNYSSAALGTQADPGREGVKVNAEQEVLLVNGIPETAEVLKAVFETRGHRVRRVRVVNEQSCLNSSGKPCVVIVDTDQTDEQILEQINATPQVLVGESVVRTEQVKVSAQSIFLEKPFEYPELIEAIERLLKGPEKASTVV